MILLAFRMRTTGRRLSPAVHRSSILLRNPWTDGLRPTLQIIGNMTGNGKLENFLTDGVGGATVRVVTGR